MTLHDEIAAEMHAYATAETGGLDPLTYLRWRTPVVDPYEEERRLRRGSDEAFAVQERARWRRADHARRQRAFPRKRHTTLTIVPNYLATGEQMSQRTKVPNDDADRIGHHVRLPADVSLALRIRSAQTRQSQSAIVEDALRALLNEKPAAQRKGAKG